MPCIKKPDRNPCGQSDAAGLGWRGQFQSLAGLLPLGPILGVLAGDNCRMPGTEGLVCPHLPDNM